MAIRIAPNGITANKRCLNGFVLRHLKTVEMLGVLLRIGCFSIVSWCGPASPFLIVWCLNPVDAILLKWCSRLKRDTAYTLLNGFWILVGLASVLRTQRRLL